MNTILKPFDSLYFIVGRSLLGLYFLVPGVGKIADYSGMLTLMNSKAIPMTELLLPLTILLQVGLGLMLIWGKQLRIGALLLFGLTLLINFYMHNFWTLGGDPSYGHELQNFIKNLGIAAGLLVLASKQADQELE